MREKHTVQRSIFEHYAEHEIGLELRSMSRWRDQHMDLLDRVAADINLCGVEDTGARSCDPAHCAWQSLKWLIHPRVTDAT